MTERLYERFSFLKTGYNLACQITRPVSWHSLREKKAGLVRYGVVGLGHIAQIAVLPAFRNAGKNSRLVALFSDDQVKCRELGRRYRVPRVASYHEYETVLERG